MDAPQEGIAAVGIDGRGGAGSALPRRGGARFVLSVAFRVRFGVAVEFGHLGAGGRLQRRVADEGEADEGERPGHGGDEPQVGREAAGRGDRRNGHGGHARAQGLGHLTDAHGQSAAVAGEPAHDDATGRRVHRGGGSAGGGDDDDHPDRRVDDEDRGGREHGGQTDPQGHRQSLTEAVGECAPGDEGEDESEARSSRDGAGLGECEAEVGVHIRDEESGSCDRDGRGHLREDTDDEDHPGLPARSVRRHRSRLAAGRECSRNVSDRGGRALPIKCVLSIPPIAQSAEAVDLKSIQCGFESHWGDHSLSTLSSVRDRRFPPIAA